MARRGGPLPKFGEWDVNNPASAEGFTVIFNKARNEKKTGGKVDSPPKEDSKYKHGAVLGKPHPEDIDFLYRANNTFQKTGAVSEAMMVPN